MRIHIPYRECILWLSAAALGFFLTGCVQRSAGGSLTQKGMSAIEAEDLYGALSLFSEAQAAGEDEVMLQRGQGIALLGLGRYEEAAAAFQKAMDAADERMPKTVRDLKHYYVTTQYRLDHYEEVIRSCQELLQEESSADLYFLLGASWLAQGEAETAREYFDHAASLSTGDYGMFLQIYECYEKHNLTGVGDEYLQTALGFVAKSSEDQYEAGKIYFYLEQYDRAREILSEPVDKNYLPAMRLMGEVYLKLEDYAHAQAMYQSVLEKEGESADAYNGLALCALSSGNSDEALRWIEKGLALEEEEGKQQLRFNEIVAYERKLDFSTALVKAEAYNELYPSDPAGRKELTFLRTR